MMNEYAKQLSDHLPVVIALAVGFWWLMTRAKAVVDSFREFVGHELEERLPRLLKEELTNGLGDLVESKMRKALEAHALDDQQKMREEIRQLEDRIRGSRRRR